MTEQEFTPVPYVATLKPQTPAEKLKQLVGFENITQGQKDLLLEVIATLEKNEGQTGAKTPIKK